MKRETRLWLKYAKEDFENMQIMSLSKENGC